MSDQGSDALTAAEEAELKQLSSADYARAKSLARTRVAGVIGWTAEDLLQETITKLLEDKRGWPRGIHPLVVLATAMDGVASNTRKRVVDGPVDPYVAVDSHPPEDERGAGRHATAVAIDNVEAAVIAKGQLETIEEQVAGDEEAG